MVESMPSTAGAMTVGALVREMTEQLAQVGIADAKREAGDIVAAVNDVPRFWALLHEGDRLSEESVVRMHEQTADLATLLGLLREGRPQVCELGPPAQ